eukprot:9347831-Pyramimonas_sp.AAC.1
MHGRFVAVELAVKRGNGLHCVTVYVLLQMLRIHADYPVQGHSTQHVSRYRSPLKLHGDCAPQGPRQICKGAMGRGKDAMMHWRQRLRRRIKFKVGHGPRSGAQDQR